MKFSHLGFIILIDVWVKTRDCSQCSETSSPFYIGIINNSVYYNDIDDRRLDPSTKRSALSAAVRSQKVLMVHTRRAIFSYYVVELHGRCAHRDLTYNDM